MHIRFDVYVKWHVYQKEPQKNVDFFYKKIKYVGWEYVEMKFFVFSTCDIYIMLKFVDFINLSISFCTFERPETKKNNFKLIEN